MLQKTQLLADEVGSLHQAFNMDLVILYCMGAFSPLRQADQRSPGVCRDGAADYMTECQAKLHVHSLCFAQFQFSAKNQSGKPAPVRACISTGGLECHFERDVWILAWIP